MGSALGHLATGRLFPSHMPAPLPTTASRGRLSLQPRSVLRACTEPGTCAVTGPGMNGRVNAGNGNNVFFRLFPPGIYKGHCFRINHFPEDNDYDHDSSEYLLRECRESFASSACGGEAGCWVGSGKGGGAPFSGCSPHSLSDSGSLVQRTQFCSALP